MPPPFLEGLTAVQQGMARDYNQTFVPLDWMPAKKPTDKLREILEIHDHDPEGWRELIADVAAHPETWPKRRRSRTIFRIGWDNI